MISPAHVCISKAGLEERPSLAGIHVWDLHEGQQVLAHPRGSHLEGRGVATRDEKDWTAGIVQP